MNNLLKILNLQFHFLDKITLHKDDFQSFLCSYISYLSIKLPNHANFADKRGLILKKNSFILGDYTLLKNNIWRTRKWGECGSDKKLLWLAFLLSSKQRIKNHKLDNIRILLDWKICFYYLGMFFHSSLCRRTLYFHEDWKYLKDRKLNFDQPYVFYLFL